MADLAKAPKALNGKPTYAADYHKSDTDTQVWLGNPHIDNLVSVSLALGAEIWALKQRQIISERLAENNVFPTTAAIEAYKPTKDEEDAWDQERQALAKRVYGWFAREAAAPTDFSASSTPATK
ncbi:MAG: hypothetical protein SFV21_07925 [Rhodospirillaceae bacterium]|nr:hypothetical protein [Rhodospirillaceae bacterium]